VKGSLILAAGAVALLDDDSFYARTDGGLARIEKVDGSMTIITTAGPSAIGYYFHDTNVYWVDGATVVRVPKTGGPSEVVLNLGDPDSMVLGIGFDACNLYVGVETTDDAKYAIWGQGLSAPAFPSCGAPYAFLGDDDASTVDASVVATQLSTVDASLVATQLARDPCSD
jgi:hypothetical protein